MSDTDQSGVELDVGERWRAKWVAIAWPMRPVPPVRRRV
jgi:hypothetical protein